MGDTCLSVRGKFLDIVSQDPSDSKSNRLHVDILWFCFHSFEVLYFIDSSKMIGNPPEVANFNRLFLKLNRFIYKYPPVLPQPGCLSTCQHLQPTII